MNDKKIGALIGLAIGDAMGGPYEFKRKEEYNIIKEYTNGGAFNLRKGEYTDDTSMALCLAESLLEKQTFDAQDQMNKYLNWFKHGYKSTRNHCFDIGGTTRTSLLYFEKTNEPFYPYKGYMDEGNAPIMRLSPIPIFFNKVQDVIKYARLSSKTTHNSNICADSAEFFAQLIKNAINGIEKSNLEDNIKTEHLDSLLKERMIRCKKEELKVLPTGYILNTLEVALHAFYKYDSFIDGLLFVISLGEDADTVGAIYGQIAGAYYGLNGIPNYYKENLMNYNEIYKLANDLTKS